MSTRHSSPVLRVVPQQPVLVEEGPLQEGSALDEPRVAQEDAGLESAPEQIPIDRLYRQYAPYVAAIASRILGRETEVQDVVHDVFVTALGGLKRRTDAREIKSWLAVVTVRSSTRQLRMRAFWNLFDLAEPPHYESLADRQASPEDRQLVSEVYRVLDAMPPRIRVAWVLRFVEGETLDGVAELSSCSLATAKRRIRAAQDVLSRKLSDTLVRGRP